jgi:hypothetical protein
LTFFGLKEIFTTTKELDMEIQEPIVPFEIIVEIGKNLERRSD